MARALVRSWTFWISHRRLVGIGEETSSSKYATRGETHGDNTNRLRVVAASDDATFLIVPLKVFHDVMNQTVGAHALALRLVNAARCVSISLRGNRDETVVGGRSR